MSFGSEWPKFRSWQPFLDAFPARHHTESLVEVAVLPSSDASVHDRGLGIGKRRVLLQSFPRCHPRVRIAWPLPEQVGKPEKLCEVAQNHWTDRWLLNPVMIRMNPQPGFYNLYLVCLKMRYHHVSLRRLLCRGLLNWRIPKTIGFHTKVAIRGFLHFRKSRFPEIHPYHPRNSPLPKLAAQFF